MTTPLKTFETFVTCDWHPGATHWPLIARDDLRSGTDVLEDDTDALKPETTVKWIMIDFFSDIRVQATIMSCARHHLRGGTIVRQDDTDTVNRETLATWNRYEFWVTSKHKPPLCRSPAPSYSIHAPILNGRGFQDWNSYIMHVLFVRGFYLWDLRIGVGSGIRWQKNQKHASDVACFNYRRKEELAKM